MEPARHASEARCALMRGCAWSQGNILEDETAINVISSSKTLSNDIAQKQVRLRSLSQGFRARPAACMRHAPAAGALRPRASHARRRLPPSGGPFLPISHVWRRACPRPICAQVVAEKTEKKIDEARAGYKPVARHVSVLFFNISELAAIEPMYQVRRPRWVLRDLSLSCGLDDVILLALPPTNTISSAYCVPSLPRNAVLAHLVRGAVRGHDRARREEP